MLRKANNVFSVVLSDVTKLTSGGTGLNTTCPVGTVVTPANIAAGALVLVDAGMRRMDLTAYNLLATGDSYFIVQGRGTAKSLMKSPILNKGKAKFTIAKFKAEVQQITRIGYNGTTGVLPVANNTNFFIKMRKRDNDAANRSQPMSLFAGPVRTDAAGTQEELAFALVKSGIQNFKDEPANGYLRFEVISDGASVTDGTATSITIAKGSRVGTLNAAATTFVVGDIIRMGTTLTSPVYKIIALSTTTITFNIPLQGDAITAGAIRYFTAFTATTANFGVTLTGIEAPFDVNQFRDYYANRFTATFSNSTTLITHAQGAFNGNGTWQQVAMDEYMSYGFEGENQQLATPSVARDQFVKIPGTGTYVAADCTYSCLNIAWEESISGLVSMDGGKGNVVVYVNLTTAGSLSATANTGNELVTSLGLTASDFNA